MTMTPEWIDEQIAKLLAISHDSEAAHAFEDKLREDVLRAISQGGCEDYKCCAFAVLQTSAIMFRRHCA